MDRYITLRRHVYFLRIVSIEVSFSIGVGQENFWISRSLLAEQKNVVLASRRNSYRSARSGAERPEVRHTATKRCNRRLPARSLARSAGMTFSSLFVRALSRINRGKRAVTTGDVSTFFRALSCPTKPEVPVKKPGD